MLKLICTFTLLIIGNHLFSQNLEKPSIQNEFRLVGDSISFPLTLVNAFPFISGEVNGVKGKFMFDTGHEGALSINNTMVPLSMQQNEGERRVGRGQKYTKYNNESIKEIKLINGMQFQDLKNIESGNYDFLQHNITPDCIGYIGYEFFKGYLFKLDYVGRKLTFYKNTPAREASKDFLNNEKLVAVLDFETRNRPNNPIIKVKVKDVEMLAIFDTGSDYGLLGITDKDTEKLKRTKNIINYGINGKNDSLFTLNEIQMNSSFTIDIMAIEKFEGNFTPVAKSLGVTEDNFLLIAHRFLAKYKTVWDYEHKKIYVLAY